MTCLDTSFIIDVLRGNPEINKIEKALEVSSKPVNVTTVTIMEVSRGIHLSNFPEIEKIKVHKLLSSLNILNFDKEAAFIAGEIETGLIRKGEKIDLEDIMTAAIVINNNETLLTRNTKHFSRINNLKLEAY